MRQREDFLPYRTLRTLAEGGTATVHAAVHIHSGEEVALKVLSPELSSEPEWRARLLQEARLARDIQHPGLVKVCSMGESSERRPYLVLELLRGQTLAERLDAESRLAALTLPDVLELGAQAADVLAAVHAAGVVHRDLSPRNLFLEDTAQDGALRVRVLDLGLARRLRAAGGAPSADEPEAHESHEAREDTRPGFGSIGYVAPEQIHDAAAADGRADVYALGAILFEALAGCRPFACERAQDELYAQLSGSFLPLSVLAPAVPPRLTQLIERMLALSASARPDMSSVRSELLALKESLRTARSALPPLPTADHTGRCYGMYTEGTSSMASH